VGVGIIDILVFVIFVVVVIGIGLWQSRGEETHGEHGAQDYFLAGRGLTWWLVGFSLIAANISTEQFVGMSGKAADWLGMAIASYEWMAAITLVVVAFLFVPTFLKSGIYTIPEFLEYRYNPFARMVMAISTLIILVGVPTASVIYSGAKVITVNFQGQAIFGLDLGSITVGCWIIGCLAAVYVFAGGLKACAWADLIQGTALIVGGAIIAYLAMKLLGNADPSALAATATSSVDPAQLADAGAIERLQLLNAGDWQAGKLHMVRPPDDPEVPWTALVVGLWIPNFFYWGLNQYITQRTLGSKSLAEGQRGVVFAAFLKLLIPFVVVIPGILAYNLFTSDLETAAVVKNAKAIATFAPDLYSELSDEVKPDPNEPLFVNDIKAINKRIEAARAKPPTDVTVFRFTETFAGSHTTDALRILSYNANRLGIAEPQGPAGAGGKWCKQRSGPRAGVARLRRSVPGPHQESVAGWLRPQGFRPGGDLRRRRELASLNVELVVDHLRDGHLPQGEEGAVPVRAGFGGPDLRCSFRIHRDVDRAAARQPEIRWHLHLHPGVPGIHQPRHPVDLPLRCTRPPRAPRLRHCRSDHQPDPLRRAQALRSGHRLPQPHGDLLLRDSRGAGDHDRAQAAARAGHPARQRNDGHADRSSDQDLRSRGGPADADPLRDLLVGVS
jgi:SSS family transporter